ncbi:MAG: carbonic anhydrase, partial [Bacteriovorax sp.]|nr:carbonic anhydrase [Rhizobacter sp.]
MTTQLQELLDSNRLWAAKTEARSPGFFTELLRQQA